MTPVEPEDTGGEMSELDHSYELIGRILSELVSYGLRRISFSAAHFAIDGTGDNGLFMDVMTWLCEENFIRAEGPDSTAGYWSVQLTSRGVGAIESRAFDKGGTVRAEVEAKKGELSASNFTKIGAFVGGLMGGAAKTLGG